MAREELCSWKITDSEIDNNEIQAILDIQRPCITWYPIQLDNDAYIPLVRLKTYKGDPVFRPVIGVSIVEARNNPPPPLLYPTPLQKNVVHTHEMVTDLQYRRHKWVNKQFLAHTQPAILRIC